MYTQKSREWGGGGWVVIAQAWRFLDPSTRRWQFSTISDRQIFTRMLSRPSVNVSLSDFGKENHVSRAKHVGHFGEQKNRQHHSASCPVDPFNGACRHRKQHIRKRNSFDFPFLALVAYLFGMHFDDMQNKLKQLNLSLLLSRKSSGLLWCFNFIVYTPTAYLARLFHYQMNQFEIEQPVSP